MTTPGTLAPLVARVDPRMTGAILAGGFVGAVARAELEVVLRRSSGNWPWPTLAVNVAGSHVLLALAYAAANITLGLAAVVLGQQPRAPGGGRR